MAAAGYGKDAIERGNTEYDASGREYLWSWASVHVGGVLHFAHDHPRSLVSGTMYINLPEASVRRRLRCLSPRPARAALPAPPEPRARREPERFRRSALQGAGNIYFRDPRRAFELSEEKTETTVFQGIEVRSLSRSIDRN